MATSRAASSSDSVSWSLQAISSCNVSLLSVSVIWEYYQSIFSSVIQAYVMLLAARMCLQEEAGILYNGKIFEWFWLWSINWFTDDFQYNGELSNFFFHSIWKYRTLLLMQSDLNLQVLLVLIYKQRKITKHAVVEEQWHGIWAACVNFLFLFLHLKGRDTVYMEAVRVRHIPMRRDQTFAWSWLINWRGGWQ